ncbi:MAG: FecR family protein [Cyanobacteria bacterium]|nr:FecR family protein [Cyanobacteriota bacterium]MDW8199629.1 hypothetical protein [Cyanobacteriota bacterium SKYGB_h_bin112]
MTTNLTVRKLKRWLDNRYGRVIGWLAVAVCSCLLTIGLHSLPAFAQSRTITQATITEILQSNQVYIQNRLAQVRDIARSGERIRTGQARASLRFNTGAIGRLGTNAVLTVGNQCVHVQQGQVLVNGAANACTRNYIAGVRGTLYLIDVDEQQHERFTVLEGQVNLTRRDRPTAPPVILTPGRRVTINNRGIPGQVQSLTQQEFNQILNSDLFQSFQEPLPGFNALKQSYNQLFPGTVFPLDQGKGAQHWSGTVNLLRVSSQGRPAIALQLTIRNKPQTTYANAVYQIYARKDNRWIPVYSNVGARLLPSSPGAVTPPPEVIPLVALRLDQLGLTPQATLLRGVVLLRYDLPNGARDQRLILETTQSYRDL